MGFSLNTYMSKVTPGKWALGICATIVLGALGSGLWDVALKPVFAWIGRAILTGLTFGFASMRDSYYVDVARGQNDRASLWLASVSVIAGIYFFTAMFAYRRGRRKGRLAAKEDWKRIEAKFPSQEARLAAVDMEAMRLNREIEKLERIGILLAVLVISFLLFRVISLEYVSSAASHFEQDFAICSPYISETDRLFIRSQYAQMRSRDDYNRLLQRLEDVAHSNGVSLPEFTPW